VGYESLKRWFGSMRKDGQTTTIDLLVAGGLAGFAAWVPSYPQDVIKSCYQNDLRYRLNNDREKKILTAKKL
jgi:solute carrier family 25 carnitine/acylcarnitine transporter 20/29